MRRIACKTEDQQAAMLALHRMRLLLIKFRTMQVNQLRSLLYEFGITLFDLVNQSKNYESLFMILFVIFTGSGLFSTFPDR
ncbi:hypothetical protein SAMN05421755_10463 [Nitrosomonas sp. Nm33]|nr:hypothetical protein SAMN05421755_10463 [Nitrosomonas sp. Nm33]